jgi:beta-galactosidase GanA
VILAGAKPVAWYADGPAAGGPAITRHDLGAGRAWYLSARADAATTAALLATACESAGLTPPATPADPAASADPAAPADPATPGGWPHGLELVRRTDGQRRVTTLINHGTSAAAVRLADRIVTVAPGDVQVLSE